MSLRFGGTGFETPSPSRSAAGSEHCHVDSQADLIDGFGFEIDNFAGTPGSPRSPPPNAKASATESERIPVMIPAPPPASLVLRCHPQQLASSYFGPAEAERLREYMYRRAILVQNRFLPLSAWETRCCECCNADCSIITSGIGFFSVYSISSTNIK